MSTNLRRETLALRLRRDQARLVAGDFIGRQRWHRLRVDAGHDLGDEQVQ
jgi:hypothetical protein